MRARCSGYRPPFTLLYSALRAALRAVALCMPLRRLDNVTAVLNDYRGYQLSSARGKNAPRSKSVILSKRSAPKDLGTIVTLTIRAQCGGYRYPFAPLDNVPAEINILDIGFCQHWVKTHNETSLSSPGALMPLGLTNWRCVIS